MTNRIALSLLLMPIAACKCGPQLQANDEHLVCNIWDAGAIGVNYPAVFSIDGGALQLTANGDSNVSIETVTIVDDGGGFSLAKGPTGFPSFVPAGASEYLQLQFVPKQPGPDDAFVVIVTDQGELTCDLFGTGIDECMTINAHGGCDAGIGACAGTCTNGACQWPTSGMCADGTQCITDGMCNGMGGCAGPSSCVPMGTCDGGNYTGQIATLNGFGHCNPSETPDIPGSCSYNTATEICDCGCGTLPNGTTGCLYNWTLDPSSPTQSFGSVWASQSGDAWATAANGSRVGTTQVIPMAFYERANGTWTQQATLALGSNPIAGASGTVALTGDQSGDIYGASACSFPDMYFDDPGTSTPTGDCGDAGIWKWTGGAASVEPLAPPSFMNASGDDFDFPLSYPVMLGSTAAFLNSDPTGPEIMTENGGQFGILGGSQIQVHCSANGALWGTLTSDVYIGWGCSPSGSGGLWHSTGTTLSTTPDFPFNTGDYTDAMAGTSDSDIWAVGTQRWHYNGTSWSQQSTPVPPVPGAQGVDQSIWAAADGTYFVSGTYAGVPIYHFDGTNWNPECLAPGYNGNDPAVSQVAGDSNGNYYAASLNGIFKRADGGQ